jgi:hypothetical protein
LIGKKTIPGLLQTTTDVAVIRWDDAAKDDEEGNENAISFTHTVVWLNGGVEEVLIEDADGDGIINAQAGKVSKARLTFHSLKGGITEKAVLVADAGIDSDFDTEEDNALYSGKWTRMRGNELLSSAEFLDADGDGKVTDNTLASSLVDVILVDHEPADKPWVAKQEAEIRMKVLAHEAGEEPISFHFVEYLKNGRENEISLRNSEGGKTFIANDTMTVILETRKTRQDDTLRSARIEFVMNPGSDLSSEDDDLLYALHVKTESRLGFERSAEFHFISDEPVTHGQEPKAGAFEGKATYANGHSTSVSGHFSPSGFSIEFTGPEGNQLKVEMDASGSVVANP